MRRLLIAGAGSSAWACLEQLSRLKHPFSITVLEGPGARHDAAGPESDPPSLDRFRVDVRPEVCVQGIDRYAKVVRGCDGSRTTFDTLILAAESENPRLARAAGLEVRSGVVLNDFLQTSDAHVYALGEGAEHRGTVYTDAKAVDAQARVLAAHLAGNDTAPFQFPVAAGFAAPPQEETAPAGLENLSTALRTYAGVPASSADSAPRSEAQTPAPEGQPVLVGAV